MLSQQTIITTLAQAALAPVLLHILVQLLNSTFAGRLWIKQIITPLEHFLFREKLLHGAAAAAAAAAAATSSSQSTTTTTPSSLPQQQQHPSNAHPKILLTGATGYVGGSVLHALLSHPSLQTTLTSSNPITVPVRGDPARLTRLATTYGARVKPVPITSLDDIPAITHLASQHDIVINAASGFHPPSAKALVGGVARRKAEQEQQQQQQQQNREGVASASASAAAAATPTPTAPVWMIHTSGCSNIADKPVTGISRPDVEYEDAKADHVFAFEEAENKRDWYPQRAAELAVLDIVQSGGANIPSGRKGIIFPTAGRTLTVNIARKCLDVAFATGNLPKKQQQIKKKKSKCGGDVDGGPPQKREIRTFTIQEAAEATTAGNTAVAETGWGGRRKTKGTVAREKLGWKPVYLDAAWDQDYEMELRAAVNGQRKATIAACIANTK